MGRSYTPKYRVNYGGVTVDGRPVHHTPGAWNSKYAGRPTNSNLARHVRVFETSTQPGYCNEHLGATRVGWAEIIEQGTDRVVAEYQAVRT